MAIKSGRNECKTVSLILNRIGRFRQKMVVHGGNRSGEFRRNDFGNTAENLCGKRKEHLFQNIRFHQERKLFGKTTKNRSHIFWYDNVLVHDRHNSFHADAQKCAPNSFPKEKEQPQKGELKYVI